MVRADEGIRMALLQVGALVALVGGLACSVARTQELKAPKALPIEVSDKWKKAGAKVGWTMIEPQPRFLRFAMRRLSSDSRNSNYLSSFAPW
jgi:hypothetical protein